MGLALQTIAVIPVFNRPRAILSALTSVAAQTQPPAELIVVDDGSTDDTAAVVEKWLAHNRRSFPARLIRQANAGPSGARNRGVAAGPGSALIAFLDSDDLWPVDYLQRMQEVFASDANIVGVSCDLLNTWTAAGRPARLLSARAFAGAVTARLVLGNPPGLPATVVRAAAFQQLGGFDPALPFAEDYHLLLRLSLLGPWGYAAGQPVTRRLDCGEAVIPQSRRFAQRTAMRARMLDRFLEQEGGARSVPAAQWRPHLAHLWYRAGRSLRPLSTDGEAHACFRRALELDPLHLRARWASLVCR